jgi:hypothetical protein
MYVQGFVDISGGNLILRNNSNLYMTGGDISLNGKLFVNGDVSLNSRLFVTSDICTNTINTVANSATKWAVQNALPINGTWSSTAVSQTAQYMLATQNTGNVYLSSNYGSAWAPITSIPTTGAWTSAAMSSTAQYMIATTNGAGVYVSPYYGASGSWVQIQTSVLPTAGNYMNSAISSNGQYMMVANNTTGSAYISTAYGASGSWGQVTSAMGLPTNSAWAGLAMSGTGQYMLAAQNTGSVYLSYTYGQSWLTIPTATLPNTGAWQKLSISSTGQYMLAANNSAGSVYLSTNFGTTWTAISALPANGNWYTTTISTTGQYMLAANNSAGSAYYSSDYGTTWAAITALPTSNSWRSVSISSTGLYILAAINGGAVYTSSAANVTNIMGNVGVNNSTPNYALDVSGQINASQGLVTTGITGSSTTAFQQNWAPITSLPSNGYWYFGNCSMSSTGQYMVAASSAPGAVYLSNNYGVTWSMIPSGSLPTNVTWRSVTVSSTGQYMLSCVSTSASNAYISNNYGVTWSTITALSTANWSSVSISSTGQYMLAGINSGVAYLNTNYGVGAWTSLASSLPTNGIWFASAFSSTGQYVLVGNNNSGGFYLSSNYGTSWSLLSNGLLTASTPIQCSMSSTGQYMIALYSNSSITSFAFITNNFGESWAPIPLNGQYGNTSSISSTGQYMFLTASGNNYIWYSTNYGNTWSAVTALTAYASANINSSAMSSNGQYILAGNGNGQLYLSAGIPITTMGINNPNPQYALDVAGNVNLNNALTTGSNYGANSTWSIISTNIGNMNSNGCIAVSSTGQYMLVATGNATGVYASSNFGASWYSVTGLTTNVAFNCTAMSSTGQYMLASLASSTSTVYLSTNYGVTWTAISSSYLPATNAYWALDISSTGQYMAVGAGQANLFYVNNNYGAGAWTTPTTGAPVGYISIAMSATGQYITTCCNSSSSNAGVYLSTNYGVTWASSSLPTLNTWWNLGMSSTGQYIIASGVGNVSISSNYGVNWIMTTIPTSSAYQSCCISSTGQYMFAYTATGGYVSNTYGATWTALTALPAVSGPNMRFSAMSGNGQYILTTLNGNWPYLSRGSDICTNVAGQLTVATGNVGIGTTNPAYPLDVTGIGRATSVISATPYYFIQNGASIATNCAWGSFTNCTFPIPTDSWINSNVPSSCVSTISGGNAGACLFKPPVSGIWQFNLSFTGPSAGGGYISAVTGGTTTNCSVNNSYSSTSSFMNITLTAYVSSSTGVYFVQYVGSSIATWTLTIYSIGGFLIQRTA